MTSRPLPPSVPVALGLVAATLLAAVALFVAPVRADGPGCLAPDDARRAVAAGGLVGASEALRAARGERRVEVLGLRLCEEEGGGHAYLITVLHRDGRVERLSVDARTGGAR